MRISDWSSDVCSSDLLDPFARFYAFLNFGYRLIDGLTRLRRQMLLSIRLQFGRHGYVPRSLSQSCHVTGARRCIDKLPNLRQMREGEIHRQIGEIGRAHVELQSLMRMSYAVFCLKKKKQIETHSK